MQWGEPSSSRLAIQLAMGGDPFNDEGQVYVFDVSHLRGNIIEEPILGFTSKSFTHIDIGTTPATVMLISL
jgi:hypothetical protein